MPKFSSASFSKLCTCHSDLQALFYEVIKYVDCKILEGFRDELHQEAAYNNGTTKLHWPHGKHNTTPSTAIDVSPYPIPDWEKSKADFYYFGGFVMGIANMLKANGKMAHGVRYGADWNKNQRISDETFVDAVHFELII